MKKLALFLALALLMATIPSAALAEATELAPYELVWYTLGTPADGDAAVMEAINEYLTEKFNCTLRIIASGAAEHDERLNLLINGMEKFDLCFVAQDYASYVAMEAFYSLTDLLDEYGQDILAQYPQSLWDSVTIRGEIYAVPTHKYSCSHYYYMFNKGAADAAGVDLSWINGDGTKMEKWESFKETLYALKEANASPNGYITNLGTGPFNALYPTECLTGNDNEPGVVTIGGDSFANQEPGVVFNQYDTPEFEAYVRDAYAMAQAGILPLDPETTVGLAEGDIAVQNQDSMGKRLPGYEAQYGIELEAYFINYAFTNTNKIYGSMNAISATSEDPARAMMFLNEMIASTEFANLVFYGIEGVNWNRNENGQIEMTNPKTYNMTTWALPGFLTAEPDVSLPIDMVDHYNAFAETLVYADNMGFALDKTPITVEMAAISNVMAEYLAPLCNGLSDPDENLPKFREALKAAGVDTVIAEIQSQLDDWRAERGM